MGNSSSTAAGGGGADSGRGGGSHRHGAAAGHHLFIELEELQEIKRAMQLEAAGITWESTRPDAEKKSSEA